MERSTIFDGKTNYFWFLWQFSIAMLVYQRVHWCSTPNFACGISQIMWLQSPLCNIHNYITHTHTHTHTFLRKFLKLWPRPQEKHRKTTRLAASEIARCWKDSLRRVVPRSPRFGMECCWRKPRHSERGSVRLVKPQMMEIFPLNLPSGKLT